MAANGTFSGTPTTPGTYPFTVQVTDNNGSTTSKGLSITVNPALFITTTSLPDAYTGGVVAYSGQLVGGGGHGSTTWSITGGSLPTNLLLSAISGSIGGFTTGSTQSFNAVLTDSNGVSTSKPLSITVYSLPSIATASPLPDGYVGLPYTVGLSATGGKGSYNFSYGGGGSMPPGLSVATGQIGTSITGGSNNTAYSFIVNVTDSNNAPGSKTFNMTLYTMPQVNNASLTTATEGIPYMKAPLVNEQIQASLGKPSYSYSATGLPTGLSVDPSTGNITGVPAQNSSTGSPYNVTLVATDANGKQGTKPLLLVVQAAKPIAGSGTNSTAPGSAVLTDWLTVFVVDNNGNPVQNVGVRLRKNGAEMGVQALTDATGKAFFSGLGFDGVNDKVDITANSLAIIATTYANLNAALVTMEADPVDSPMLRAGAVGVYDGTISKAITTMGTAQYSSASNFTRRNFLNDVAQLNQATSPVSWIQSVRPAMASSPPGRRDAMMAWTGTAGGGTILFGGVGSNGMALNDVWKFTASSSTWTQQPTVFPSPPPRSFAAMTQGDGTGKLAMFGGLFGNGQSTNQFWRYDSGSNTWTDNSGLVGSPTARYGMGATYRDNGGIQEMWICGGYSGTPSPALTSECYSISSANVWTTRPNLPAPRAYFTMVTDPVSKRIYAYGGRGLNGAQTTDTSDVMVFDGTSWNTASSQPAAFLRLGSATFLIGIQPSTRW